MLLPNDIRRSIVESANRRLSCIEAAIGSKQDLFDEAGRIVNELPGINDHELAAQLAARCYAIMISLVIRSETDLHLQKINGLN